MPPLPSETFKAQLKSAISTMDWGNKEHASTRVRDLLCQQLPCVSKLIHEEQLQVARFIGGLVLEGEKGK